MNKENFFKIWEVFHQEKIKKIAIEDQFVNLPSDVQALLPLLVRQHAIVQEDEEFTAWIKYIIVTLYETRKLDKPKDLEGLVKVLKEQGCKEEFAYTIVERNCVYDGNSTQNRGESNATKQIDLSSVLNTIHQSKSFERAFEWKFPLSDRYQMTPEEQIIYNQLVQKVPEIEKFNLAMYHAIVLIKNRSQYQITEKLNPKETSFFIDKIQSLTCELKRISGYKPELINQDNFAAYKPEDVDNRILKFFNQIAAQQVNQNPIFGVTAQDAQKNEFQSQLKLPKKPVLAGISFAGLYGAKCADLHTHPKIINWSSQFYNTRAIQAVTNVFSPAIEWTATNVIPKIDSVGNKIIPFWIKKSLAGLTSNQETGLFFTGAAALYGGGLLAYFYKNHVNTRGKKTLLAGTETLLKGAGVTVATAGLCSSNSNIRKLVLAAGGALTVSKAVYDGVKELRSF